MDWSTFFTYYLQGCLVLGTICGLVFATVDGINESKLTADLKHKEALRKERLENL